VPKTQIVRESVDRRYSLTRSDFWLSHPPMLPPSTPLLLPFFNKKLKFKKFYIFKYFNDIISKIIIKYYFNIFLKKTLKNNYYPY